MIVIAAMLAAQPSFSALAKGQGVCAKLALDWTRVEQNMAARAVAPDQTDELRKLHQGYDMIDLERSKIALELMKLQSCPTPDRTPGPYEFLKAASDCEIARTKAQGSYDVPACDRSKWIRGE